MQHKPAPTATDIELMLTRPRPAAPRVPVPAPEPLTDYAPVERATIRQRWLAHFAALVDYGVRLALWAIILSSFVALIVV